MRLQFGLDAFEHRSKSIAAQRIINAYLEKTTDNASNPIALVGSFGIDDFAEIGAGPMRGGKVVNGVPYIVSGIELYQVNEDGTGTLLGAVPGADWVTIAGDGTNLAVCAAGWLYVWNGTTVAAVTDPDFPGADTVDFLQTYYLITKGGLIYLSDSLNPGSWNALQFLEAEASPDDIVGTIVEKAEFFAGGRDSIQSFYVSAEQVPLTRVPEGIAEAGLLAKFGFGKIDNTIFLPCADFTVRMLVDYFPVPISTPALCQAIEDLTDDEKRNLRGMCFAEGGHTFYALTSVHWTYVYDSSTKLWHQRKSYGRDNWRVLFALTAYNRVLVGDSTSNKLGALSPNVFTEWGDPLVMLGTCHVQDDDYRPIFFGGLELVFDRGPGTSTGQGSNPHVMMRQSFDAGKTWSKQRMRPLGKIGEFRARAFWSRPGSSPDRVIEFAISDPVRRALSYANLIDEEVGDHAG